MFSWLKVLLMLGSIGKFKLSLNQLEALTARLIAFLVIGMFLASLAALMVTLVLMSVFRTLTGSGFDPFAVLLVLTLVVGGIFTVGVIMMDRYLKGVRSSLHKVANTDPSLLGRVGHVAESFVSGLLQTQSPNTITRRPPG